MNYGVEWERRILPKGEIAARDEGGFHRELVNERTDIYSSSFAWLVVVVPHLVPRPFIDKIEELPLLAVPSVTILLCIISLIEHYCLTAS